MTTTTTPEGAGQLAFLKIAETRPGELSLTQMPALQAFGEAYFALRAQAAEGEQGAAHAAAREAVAAALAVFPINLDGQSFRIGRDPLLQADGDDVFYSRKKANQIFQGLFDHLKGIESALAATPAPAHPLPVAGEETFAEWQWRFVSETGRRPTVEDAFNRFHAAPAGEKGGA